MPAFSSRSRSPTHPILAQVRRHPFVLFGLPFLSLVVASSFALQAFTQTRYDYHGQKVQTLSQAEALGMDKNRKRVDIREEFYRLNATSSSSDAALDASTSASTESPDSSMPVSRPSSSRRPKFSMAPVAQDDYEPVRVPRPSGVPEWGAGQAGEEAPLKGRRKEDRPPLTTESSKKVGEPG
ncbi:Cytochrome c oxidase assembly protein COX16, mitochondrial [Saitozyma sp. JCM 24511]|nr:Cytochrome c oxidase assembly protein COX16, mitochondrial [Saitozyma sp. JCM 24511]